MGARFVACTVDTVTAGRAFYVDDYAAAHGSVVVGLHEESADYESHMGSGFVVGGYVGDDFTNNSYATVLIQGFMKNFGMRGASTGVPDVTSNLVLPGYGDPTSPENGVLGAGSSDIDEGGTRWHIRYGNGALAGYWGMNWHVEPPFLSWTVDGTVYGASNPTGTSLLWIPRGAFRGNGGGYPEWYEFVNETSELEPTLIRGGLRPTGDRMRTASALSAGLAPATPTYGAPAERVVLTDGFDAKPWKGAGMTVVGLDTVDVLNAEMFRPSEAANVGQTQKILRCTVGGTTGAGEPDVSGATDPGVDTITDGTVTWLYVGDTPVVGSTVLGTTLTGTSDDEAPIALLDEYGHELTLPEDSSFALRVTVLGSRTDAQGIARDVYEISAHTGSTTLTIDDGDASPINASGGLTAAGWSAAFSDVGRSMRITCASAAGQSVSFKARIDVTALPGA